jgi:hypothetical protein
VTSPLLPHPARPTSNPGDALGWPRTALRMFLLILPTQLVGSLLTSRLVPLDSLVAHPWLGWLPNALVGLLLGVVLGLVLRPSRDRLVGSVLLSAAVNLAVTVALFLVVMLRVPDILDRVDRSGVVSGALLTVVLQSALAGVLWWQKDRGRP